MRASAGRIVTGLITLIAALVLAPSAHAAFGLTGAAATPASTNAGANTNFTLTFDTPDAAEDLKDLTVHLPPGLVGNPLAAPMCTEAQLNADGCPAASDVGDISNDLTVTVLDPLVLVPLTVNGDVYNVVPHQGEPARFGIVLRPLAIPPIPSVLPPIILQSAAKLRDSDFGLDTILNDLPNTSSGLPIHIESTTLTLSGMAGSPPKGFIRLPTSCKTHTVEFDGTAYSGATASAQATFTTDNCAALPFTPELSARIKRVGAENVPVELSTTIAQTIEEAGLLRAEVVLPAGIGGNNEVLNNQCSPGDFAAGNCPAPSIVGFAAATSPLQAEGLIGTVALVTPASPGLPDLGIDLRGPLALKLKGTLAFTPEGRNIVVFDNLPDIPISEFTLTFAGGPGGLVAASRDVCVPPPLTFDANFLAHSGATLAATADPTVDCSEAGGGGGGGGGGSGNRKPRATVELGRLGSEKPKLKLKVKGGSEKLRQATLLLPKRLGFARGKRFDRGTTVAKVKVRHTRKALKLKSAKPAKRLRARIGHGALVPGKGLKAGTKLRFKLRIRDARGKTTKLTVTGR